MHVSTRNALRTAVALLLFAAVALVRPAAAQEALSPNLLANGSFAAHTHAGGIASWLAFGGAAPVARSEGEDTVLTLTTASAGGDGGIRQAIAVRPEWAKVLVRGSVRVNQLSAAGNGAANVSVQLSWRMHANRAVVAAQSPGWSGQTDGWQDVNLLLDVPAGADELIVAPEIAGAVGSADFRGLNVVAWVTTFDDEFDGKSLDTTRWTASDSNDLVYAPGEQYFAPDHVIIGDGIARFCGDNTPHKAIKPRPPLDGNYENTLYGDYQYQSGEIQTIGKFQQLYGFWEFRLKIPLVLGTWPAAYLLKWDDGWPPEIDVEECSGKMLDTVLQTNVYANDYGKMERSWVNLPSSDIDRSTWHTYAVAWEPGSISWYIDGVFKGTTQEPYAKIADVPLYIRLNLAIGTFGGYPGATSWPQNMDCDFARVYQRSDLQLPVYPCHSIEITLPENTATLSAIACNPMSGIDARWSKVEGPGAVAIDSPQALVTKASFTKPGMYRFRLTLRKGASNASADVLVYVNRD